MPSRILRSSIWQLNRAQCDALVIPVNCVGVTGAGVAKEWAFRHDRYDHGPVPFYRKLCESGEMRPGTIRAAFDERGNGPVGHILFPTKLDWRDPSKIEWIDEGLESMAAYLADDFTGQRIRRIAVPALGCGNGGLSFEDDVLPLYKRHLKPLNDEREFLLFAPRDGKPRR